MTFEMKFNKGDFVVSKTSKKIGVITGLYAEQLTNDSIAKKYLIDDKWQDETDLVKVKIEFEEPLT